MKKSSYRYIIVGGGVAGGSAPEGIREVDSDGSILLVGNETFLPYNRPMLSKQLWLGQNKLDELFIHTLKYYSSRNVDYLVEREIVDIDPESHFIVDNFGKEYRYEKLLLATGGYPRMLPIPGGDLKEVCYYRYLDDYLSMRAKASAGKKAVIIGGGYIGAELAAVLNKNEVSVTMVFPEKYLLGWVFPENLGRAVQSDFTNRGITIFSEDFPDFLEKKGESLQIDTVSGHKLLSDMVIAGIGILPSVELARMGGLVVDNMKGITVNDFLETSDRDIYAAGDNAFFPYHILGTRMRLEHWDNAAAQGHLAGRNMAGAREAYIHMPYFFSDLFDFHFEAVGNIDSRLIVVEDWQQKSKKGIVWYYKEGKVVGAMMCNMPNKVEMVRKIIKYGKAISFHVLEGIPA